MVFQLTDLKTVVFFQLLLNIVSRVLNIVSSPAY